MEKQIEEMANIIALKAFEQAHLIDGDENLADIVATDLYEKGYRKIYDDHQIQCTCYALGCQMAESLKREVARKIFEEIEEGIKAAISALQFENNPIHRQVKHETYSSLMRFIKTVEQKYTENKGE